MADQLIGLPCRFTLTNSYRFHSRAKAGDKLALIGRRMDSAGDRAHSLREELVEAMDAVDRGEYVWASITGAWRSTSIAGKSWSLRQRRRARGSPTWARWLPPRTWR